jgi:hypothetical protein
MPRGLPGFVDRAALRERLRTMPMTTDHKPGTDAHQVISWLTRLHLLQGVPFAYLVPDIGMLPAESIRFFQVDRAWLEALIDGAFSVGATRATSDCGTALRALVAPVVRENLRRVRAALVGDAEPGAAPEAITGFLLRSAVVPGWPGMEVRCYADAKARSHLPLLRLERVAPALLLCLAGGLLQRVDLQEPPEGLHFGVDEAPPPSPAPWQKRLRYASGNGSAQVGSWIPGGVQPVTFRPGTTTVLHVNALAQAMAPRVWASPLPSPAKFTAAQFGLEMVETGQAVSFQVRS